jgi:hypothetical protein
MWMVDGDFIFCRHFHDESVEILKVVAQVEHARSSPFDQKYFEEVLRSTTYYSVTVLLPAALALILQLHFSVAIGSQKERTMSMNTHNNNMTHLPLLLLALVLFSLFCSSLSFQSTTSLPYSFRHTPHTHTSSSTTISVSFRSSTFANTKLHAQISQQEAQKAIDKVVQALRKDSAANQELGMLQKVTTVLGFGSPQPDTVAVRFNASFQKSGFGRSSVPLPFGLGQSNKSEGRGTMVGQVKASVNPKTGKIVSVSVFRDLGYGRAFNLKV